MKYTYEVTMPTVTLSFDKKISKRELVKKVASILLAETMKDSHYKETKSEFKVKTIKMDV